MPWRGDEKPFTVRVREDTRAPLMYFKDAARAVVALAEAPAESIQMVNYLLAGVTPTPTAAELADMVRLKIPTAEIGFEVDEELQPMLDRILKPVDDRFARQEWGWRPGYGLEEMVDDFLRELAEHPQRYR